MQIMQDSARTPQTPINPPTGHKMSCARPGPEQPKMAILGLNLLVLGQKNRNFYWRKKKFWYPHNGKTLKCTEGGSPI